MVTSPGPALSISAVAHAKLASRLNAPASAAIFAAVVTRVARVLPACPAVIGPAFFIEGTLLPLLWCRFGPPVNEGGMAATRWSASTAGVAAAADEAYDVACHVAGASWAGPGEAAAGRACTRLPVRVSAWCVCAGRSGRRLASCGRCGGRLPSVADPTVGWRCCTGRRRDIAGCFWEASRQRENGFDTVENCERLLADM